MACTVKACLSPEHTAPAHELKCVVCGQPRHHASIPETWTNDYRELIDGFNCHSTRRHLLVQDAWALGAPAIESALGLKRRKVTKKKAKKAQSVRWI